MTIVEEPAPSQQKKDDAPPTAGRTEPKPRRFVQVASGEEARNFDYSAPRDPKITTSVVAAIGNLIKSSLGGGMVTIHEAYKNNGLISSVILNVILGLAVIYGMYMLTRSAQRLYGRLKIFKLSYPDLAEASLATSSFVKLRRFDKCFRYMVDTTIMVDLFGCCCIYQVVIARTILQLYKGHDAKATPNELRVFLACLLLPCILICMIRTLKALAPFSIVANVFVLTVAVATIYYGVRANTQSILDFPNYKSVDGLFNFIGVCVFSMEGIGAILPIENNMKKPKKIGIVLLSAISFIAFVCMIIGFFGYWGYGDAAKSPVTINFPPETFPIVLKVFMALIMWVTFALNFWLPFELSWVYISKKYAPEKHWLWERLYRALFITIITLISIILPNIGSFIGLIASFCLSCMGFIYPAVIDLVVSWEDPGLGFMKIRLVKFFLFVCFGIILFVVGTITNTIELIKDIYG